MSIQKISLLLCCFLVVCFPVLSQESPVASFVIEYLENSNNLSDYKPIEVKWTMAGPIQAEMNEGLNFLIEGEPSVALDRFTYVLNNEPTIWQAQYYRGVCHKLLGKYNEAEFDFNTVLSKQVKQYETLLELGKVRALKNQESEALKNYQAAIDIDKNRPEGYYLAGNLYLNRNDVPQAISNYRRCLKIDSMYHDARLKLSLIRIVTKSEQGKIKEIEKVLKFDSLKIEALLLHSLLIQEINKPLAIKELSSIIRRKPELTLAKFYRAVLLTESELYDQAYTDFKNLITESDLDENSFRGQQTDIDKVVDLKIVGSYTIQRIYGLPDEMAIQLKKAYCLLFINKYEESLEALNTAPGADNEPLYWYLRGIGMEHHGNHNEALRSYNVALELDSTIVDAYKKRGIYKQELKDWNGSIADFQKALQLNPETYVLHKMLGVSYYYKDKLATSIDEFSQYLKRDSLDRETLKYRGLVYYTVGDSIYGAMDLARARAFGEIDFPGLGRMLGKICKSDSIRGMNYLKKLTSITDYFTEGFILKMELWEKQGAWSKINTDIRIAMLFRRSDLSAEQHARLFSFSALNFAHHKNYEEALIAINRAIQINPGAPNLVIRARIYQMANQSEKAKKDLNKAAELGSKEAQELLKQL